MPKRRRHDSLLIEDETLSKIENTSDDVEASNKVFQIFCNICKISVHCSLDYYVCMFLYLSSLPM